MVVAAAAAAVVVLALVLVMVLVVLLVMVVVVVLVLPLVLRPRGQRRRRERASGGAHTGSLPDTRSQSRAPPSATARPAAEVGGTASIHLVQAAPSSEMKSDHCFAKSDPG